MAAFRFRGMHQQRTSYCYTSPIKPFEVPYMFREIAKHPIKVDVDVVVIMTFPPYYTMIPWRSSPGLLIFVFRSKQRIAVILPPVFVSHFTAVVNYSKYAQHTNVSIGHLLSTTT